MAWSGGISDHQAPLRAGIWTRIDMHSPFCKIHAVRIHNMDNCIIWGGGACGDVVSQTYCCAQCSPRSAEASALTPRGLGAPYM